MLCPKCSIEPPDGAVECPQCGIVFARYLELQGADGRVYRPAPREPGMDWRELLLEEAREPDPLRFWGRAALYALLFAWGWRFILSSVAENFMDIGPYVADARSGELLLLGGVTGRDVPGYHDWENVLGSLDLLQYDRTLGALFYGFGRLLMLAAFAWGGWLLARQHRELHGSREARSAQSGNF
jgi:hypothetical protein